MKNRFTTIAYLLVTLLLVSGLPGFSQVVVVTNPASPFIVPAGVTSMKVDAWGGGAAGGGTTASSFGTVRYGGGGGGGAYNTSTINVSAGQSYTIAIGAARAGVSAAAGPAGNPSSVTGPAGLVVSANGGAGGGVNGGAGAGGTGVFNGGSGSSGNPTGGGGGGGAGSAGVGSNGSNSIGAAAAAGGAGSPNAAPFKGGVGATNQSSTNSNGNSGSAPGGGGGGSVTLGTNILGTNNPKTGGTGAAGQVVITYCITPAPTAPGTVTYCQGAVASPLTATGTSLKWYNVPTGGTGSATAPTPSTAVVGTTSYYVSQTVNGAAGACEGPRATINVVVNANSTISLSSAPGSDVQTVCINNPIADITYNIGGTATNASITAGSLPTGVTGTFAANVFTISGTPTISGTFAFTVTATGICPVSLTGSITVRPNSGISLSSAPGTDAQTLCALTPLTNITYAIGGSGNGASITAGSLPAGLTTSFNSGVFTISGTPTEVGSFSYTVTTTGPCVNTSISGTVTVYSSSTISLSSSAGTDAQTVCIDNPITNITYNIGGSATGGSITAGALPAGVTGSFNAGVFTISGTPTVSGTFNYTVTATGPCPVSLTGSILVNANSTITLSSSAGTDAQTLCAGVPITPVTYAIGGGGTGALLSAGSFPTGISGSFSAGVFTITGSATQTGVFNFTISATGPCINPSLSGTFTINESSTITLSSAPGTDAQVVCIGNPITDITYAIGGSATGGYLSGGALPAGVSGSFSAGIFTITGTPTVSGSFNYTFTADGPCPVSTNGTLNVNANSAISFSSAPGTDAQTVCINTPITSITYNIGGGGTGATVSGLPAGLNGSYNSGTFTLNGAPTQAGTFNYTVTTTGPCINNSLIGTVTVTGNASITLTSAPGTNIQTVCINNPITDISYSIGGTGTGASITSGSLPAGVAGTYNSGVFTITGTPTVSGTFSYTVSTQGPCANASASGTITVNANSTITLSSAAGTDVQSLCINTAITNITYSIAGGGTGATVTGLPTGVTGSFSAGVFSITGTPTAAGNFSYTVTTAGPCINPTASGTITVIGNSVLTLTSANNTQTVCQNLPIANITYTYGGTSTGVNTAGLPPGIIATLNGAVYTLSGSPTAPGIFNYTLTTTGPCVNRVRTGTISVNAIPTGVGVTPATSTICVGSNKALSATGAFAPVTLINDNFNATPTFTGAGSASGNRAQIFEVEGSGVNVNSVETFTNGTGNIMASTVGSSNNLAAASASTTLTSPVINTTGYTLSTFTFKHVYRQGDGINSASSGKVEVSTNAGVNWTTLTTYTTNQGAIAAFASVSINLAAYSNLPSVMLRFNFNSSIQNIFSNTEAWWAIDDVVLNATQVTQYSWQASTGAGINGLPANAGTPLVSNNNITVNPTLTTTYTLTAGGQATGCGATSTSTVTVNQNSTLGLSSAAGTDAQTICMPNAITDITYNIGGGGTGASITGGSLPAGLTAVYDAGVFTISGTPAAFGNYSYTVTTTGPCVNVSASGTITVNTAPGLVCPANVTTTTDPSVCIATRTYSAAATGFPVPTVSYLVDGNFISFPYDFPRGTTIVEVLAEGACAPDASCSFTVTVADLQAPITDIASLPDVTGACTATVTDVPTATDACDGQITGTTGDPLTYNTQGTHTITWTYTDMNGNISTQTQNVIINDVTAPDITCPTAQTFCSVTGNNFTIPPAIVSDNCTVSTVTYQVTGATTRTGSGTDASGLFNPGSSTITWTVTDANNNTNTCSSMVNIQVTLLVPTVTGIQNVCPYLGTGDQVTYTAFAFNANSYSWTLPPNVNLISGAGTASITVTFNTGFAAQSNKQIRVTATNSCGTSPMAVYYLLTQFPSTPGPINGTTSVCALINTANTASYSVSPVVAATGYVWSIPAGCSMTRPNTAGGINDTIILVTYSSGFNGGPITVTATNGCGTSGIRSLNIPKTPSSTPGLVSGPTNVCANILPGGTAATYSVVPVNGATSYTWSAPAGSVVTHPNGAGPNDYTITTQFPAGFTSGNITVSSTNGCGASGLRSLALSRLSPATPSVMDVIQTGYCGDPGGRVYTYTLTAMPANATSVQWTVPTAQGALLVSGQGSTSITVSYPSTAVQGNVTAQSFNNCGSSTIRNSSVKLPACPSGFSKSNENSVDKNVHALPVDITLLDALIYPNPSISDFRLKVLTPVNEKINIRIIDMQGRALKTAWVMPYQTINIGADLKAGSYFVEIKQGNNVTIKKIQKF